MCDFQVMIFCRGAQELRRMSIWFDENTEFFPSSLSPWVINWLLICELKSHTTQDPVKRLLKNQAAAAAGKQLRLLLQLHLMRAFNKFSKIIFITVIWSWPFGATTCYLRDFHRPSRSCHIWDSSLEQRKPTCAQACAQRQTHLSLVIPCQQEWQLPGWWYLLERGKLQMRLVGSVKQGACLCSFNFPVQQTSSAHPWARRQEFKVGHTLTQRRWRASADGRLQHIHTGGCSAGSAAGGCWQVSRLCWHDTMSPSSLAGGQALPDCLRASKQIRQGRWCLRAAQLPQVLFLFPTSGEKCWGSAERQGRGQLAFVPSDSLWRHQRSLSQKWLHCLLRCKNCLIKEAFLKIDFCPIFLSRN